MTSHPELDTAFVAGSSVIAADQIMQAIRDEKRQHPRDANTHYIIAAIAGAVAVGAYEWLKRDEEAKGNGPSHQHGEHGEHGGHRHHKHLDDKQQHEFVEERRRRSWSGSDGGDNLGHAMHLLEEAVGAYALGRQLMGHKHHPIFKLVAEALGAAGFYQEALKDLER